MLEFAKKIQKPINFNILNGRIVSVDFFPPTRQSVTEELQKKADAVEMEGYAVYAVSELLHTPALIVAGISDNDLIFLDRNYDSGEFNVSMENYYKVLKNLAIYNARLIESINP
jgi:purine-nucleoside phosphorylase